MTSQTSAGVQRRPFAPSGGFPPGPVRQASQSSQSSGSQRSNKTFVDLTENEESGIEGEHHAKRQRLDTNVKSAAAVVGTPRLSLPQSATEALELKKLWERGRPAWSFPRQSIQAPTDSVAKTGKAIEIAKPPSPPPLPFRPWKNSPALDKQNKKHILDRKSTPDGEVQTTPYRLDAPEIAPIFEEDNHADFFPWTGNHPEDVLNEQAAKQGYYDRVQVSQNETNTARPSLYAVFKNRGGLQTLSGLLVSALEQRQNHHKINATSTFKPPPRVTLTEAKRKAWLSDLANPDASLRRLSRTIPQGVRGQMLLEQCLSHAIPIGRAVWFAKCVGANEIRTLKRKGTSGAFAAAAETKWIKDWTISVEQFVESVIVSCGESGWREKITYTLRFAARLYHDNLLDQDHYLDWIISSLSTTNSDRLPLWLLTMRIYWPDLVRYRRTGKPLAEGLLQKLHNLSQLEPEMLPITKRLSQLVKGFVHMRPTCFLLPQHWPLYATTLKSCLDFSNTIDKTIFDTLTRKNERIARHIVQRMGVKDRSARQNVIHLLDTAKSPYNIAALSAACLNALKDTEDLVTTVLEWSITRFRDGKARVYVALRLLRRWQISGTNIETPVLQVLLGSTRNPTRDVGTLHHIISELVRSQTFSLGRHMQSLMARGAVHTQDNTNRPDIQLLREVPLYVLPAHVQNLRNTLLNKVGFSTLAEAQTILIIKTWLQVEAPGLFGYSERNQQFAPALAPSFDNLGWTIRSEVTQWVRRSVADHYHSPISTPDTKDNLEARDVCALTLSEFEFIRDVLERIGDISMLADVIRDASNTNDDLVLAAVVDTINYHFETFSAIGAVETLHRTAYETYSSMKASIVSSRHLIVCFIELSLRLPDAVPVLRELQQDLARDERTAAVAAFSPLSDNMADSIQYTGVGVNEDLDQLWPVGANVDEQTMHRLFGSLFERLESGDVAGKQNPNGVTQLLWRLKVSKPKQFDALMFKWMEGTFQSSNRPPLTQLFPLLIGAGCISFPVFVAIAHKLLAAESARSIVANPEGVRLELLKLICPKTGGLFQPLDSVAYRFRFAQQRFLVCQPAEVLGIFRGALTESPSMLESREILDDPSIIETLRTCIARHPDAFRAELVDPVTENSASKSRTLASLMDKVLYQSTMRAQDLILLTNDYSIHFCQLRMKLLLYANSPEAPGNGAVDSSVIDALFEMAKSNVETSSTHWTSLVAALGVSAAQDLRERAEEQLLSVMTLSSVSAGFESRPNYSPATTYLNIIEALPQAVPVTGVAAMGSILVERLTSLLRHVAAIQMAQERRASEGAATYFSLLLRLVCIHRNAFSSSRNGPKEQARLVIAVTSLALSQVFTSYPAVVSNALDICAALVDELPEDARLQCVRFLRDKTRDPRVCFLFGFGMDTDTPFKVNSKTKGLVSFPVRNWEMLEDATPKIGMNDTSLSLGLFEARKAYAR